MYGGREAVGTSNGDTRGRPWTSRPRRYQNDKYENYNSIPDWSRTYGMWTGSRRYVHWIIV